MRGQVARRFKVSQATVIAWENTGKLHPTVEDGHIWHDPAEVDAFARTWKPPRTYHNARRKEPANKWSKERGRIAATVFSMLRDGADLRSIVIATKAEPGLVRELWREYQTDFERAAREQREREEQRIAERVERETRKERQREEWCRFQEKMARLRGQQKSHSKNE